MLNYSIRCLQLQTNEKMKNVTKTILWIQQFSKSAIELHTKEEKAF